MALHEVPNSEVAEGTLVQALHVLVGFVEVVVDAPVLVVELGAAGAFYVLGRCEAEVSLELIE